MPVDRLPRRKELRRVGDHIRKVTFSNRRGPDTVDYITDDPADKAVPTTPEEYEVLPPEYKAALNKPPIDTAEGVKPRRAKAR